jgi:rRNA biogenesis protein RRP5
MFQLGIQVDIFHLETPLPGPLWSEKYSENQRVKARILFVDPVKKSVGLSLNPQLINYTIPTMAPAIGDVFENAVVHRVDPTLGILVELPLKNSSAAAYIHISNVSDEHVAKLGKKYCVGKKVRARIVGFRVMDGLAIASLKVGIFVIFAVGCF